MESQRGGAVRGESRGTRQAVGAKTEGVCLVHSDVRSLYDGEETLTEGKDYQGDNFYSTTTA